MSLLVDEAVERIAPGRRAAGTRSSQRRGARRPARILRATGASWSRRVFNLLDNAVKYSDAGRRGRRAARPAATDRVAIDGGSDQRHRHPRRDLERIFERFYRVDRARSRDDRRHRPRPGDRPPRRPDHGGEVVVESREGEGSTFTLARCRLRQRHAPSSPEPPTRSRPMTRSAAVLVVEDEESFIDALTVGLAARGVRRRDRRATAPRRSTMFDDDEPDLVLLDVMLPRMSGIDVCREIRHRSERADHHGHRQGRRDRHGRRPRGRRRRLRDQALPPARAGGPHARGAAARPRRAADAPAPTRRRHRGRRRAHATSTATRCFVRGERSALPLKEFELLDAAAGERRPGAHPRRR